MLHRRDCFEEVPGAPELQSYFLGCRKPNDSLQAFSKSPTMDEARADLSFLSKLLAEFKQTLTASLYIFVNEYSCVPSLALRIVDVLRSFAQIVEAYQSQILPARISFLDESKGTEEDVITCCC